MSIYNHLHDEPSNISICNECNKKFTYSVSDMSMWGGHDSDIISCPWCGANNGEVYGGDSIIAITNKIED